MAEQRIPLNPRRIRELALGTVGERGGVGDLHRVLAVLRVDVAPAEVARGEFGPTTQAAVRQVQADLGLRATGRVTPADAEQIKQRLEHLWYAGNKTRAARVQEMLGQLGHRIDPAELRSRTFGPSSTAALRAFAPGRGEVRLDESLVERLRAEALTKRLSTRTQAVKAQKSLQRALRIAGLEARIDPAELRTGELGPSTRAAISAFQSRYGLPRTGAFDPATWYKMSSVNASKPGPMRKVDAPPAQRLAPVNRRLRLNMTGRQVATAQQALAFLGHDIEVGEHQQRRFGRTTREAVLAFQRGRRLPQSGELDQATLRTLNTEIAANTPGDVPAPRWRIRGSVRDANWAGLSGVTVRISDQPVKGSGAVLAEKTTAANGFFDVPYDPPVDPATKQIRQPVSVTVTFLRSGQVIGSRPLFNPTPIAWANLTLGDRPYRGPSEFEANLGALGPVPGATPVTGLVETADQHEVTRAALAAGLTQDAVMRLILAHRGAAALADPVIGAAAVYGWLAQNVPASMPDDLLAATDEWARIEPLTNEIMTALVFTDPDAAAAAFDAAVAENLVPVTVANNRAAILAALAGRRTSFALDKPLLTGSGTLRAVLGASALPAAKQPAVADAFVRNQGVGTAFWTELTNRAAEFGGPAVVADLRTTVDVAQIAANHQPMLTKVKQLIGDPAVTHLTSARDLAKLTVEQWQQIVTAAGGPPPGATLAGSGGYASALAARSELLFPTVAYTAEVGRSSAHGLTQVRTVAQFVDANPDFSLRDSSVDRYVAERAPSLPAAAVSDLRVMQRTHRLAPTAAAGRALLDAGLHSSVQIVSLGRDGLAAKLGALDTRSVNTIHAQAELQYAQVLHRLGEIRMELQQANPQSLAPQNFTLDDARDVLGEIPDLEVLFGSTDYCDCAGCLSVYSPAAYLADLLRFLADRPAQVGGSVLDVLRGRRPDLADIKLNCANTETSMPYIDLVCEVLEAAVAGGGPTAAQRQTTRTSAELRAQPEHLHAEAYDVLRAAVFPLGGGFDLWQEEAALLLDHLGVPRHELMAAFAGPAGPNATSIAAQFLGLSSHDAALVTTPAADTAAQTAIWGLDTGRTELTVSEFLRHTRLSYDELRELLATAWPHTDGVAPVTLVRPDDTCDPDRQLLRGFTVAGYDRIHRMLRLWRSTDWRLSELDRLLRAPGVGNGRLDGAALVRLHQFTLVARRLRLPFDRALALYAPISTEAPFSTAEPPPRSAYDQLFRNPLVTPQVDAAFTLPLPGTEPMAGHQPALAAAYQATEAELALLLPRTGGQLSLANLTVPLRHLALARGLGIPLVDALTLIDLCAEAVPDPFADPGATLALLERYDDVVAAGLGLAELDYLLRHRPDSPFDLRDDTIGEQVDALRESLRTTPAADKDGQVGAYTATAFGVTDRQAVLLLDLLGALPLLTDEALTRPGPTGGWAVETSPANFPGVWSAWRRLHKASTLLRRLRVDGDALAWLASRAGTFGLLRLEDLPVAAGAGASFERWRATAGWSQLRRRYPEPEGITLGGLFDLAQGGATIDVVRARAATLTGWTIADLATVDGGAVTFYTDVAALRQLAPRLGLARRLGVDAATAARWARRDDDSGGGQQQVTREIGQTVKARYDHEVWLSRIAPIQDQLRERRRDALVAYLLERSARTTPPTVTVGGKTYANPAHWTEPDDLLRWFCLDVQMSSCQLTSRISQAIGSVQMFVQRCQLNLERPYVTISAAEQADTTSLDSWRQWRWMKNYRVWEANRKVFLYPENWLEPELRDDKSPFFRELEDDILRQDITDANCEAAFERYLRKVHEVSRLTVVGVYHEIDDDDPYDALPPRTNVLHVVARTPAEPARYYYRTFDLSYGTWSAWEKIELDIVGDHVVPVVYNRKLHLFWLVFTEKPQKVRKQPPARASDTPQDSPQPPTQLEIQLAWSVRTADGFAARQTSPWKLVHPWQRPTSSYLLKPRYKPTENQLWLDIYLSTSQAFNNTAFYDPYADRRQRVTKTWFAETLRPWHSSSFVFDGGVVALKLKPLAGQYRVLQPDGTLSDTPVPSDSYTYVRDTTGADGRVLTPLRGGYEIAPRLALPDGMHYDNGRLTNNRSPLNGGRLTVLEGSSSATLLNGAQAPFELAVSPHRIQFDAQAAPLSPMLYQDRVRSFFIRPQWRSVFYWWYGGLGWFNRLEYTWFPFHHPYTALFLRELHRSGLDGLLNRRIQRFPESYPPHPAYSFTAGYQPTARNSADPSAAADTVDFTPYGAYSVYNWEIFFHAPLLIAAKLTANQRYDEAMTWYHRIFDPTNTDAVSAPQRYWITRPFFEQNADDYRRQRIEELLGAIDANLDQVRAWKNNPFNPHLIARQRPVAFQRAVVMRYIDNLIAWADQLFRRDSMESLNEATVLYSLAGELLGPRPTRVPGTGHADLSYAELVADGALDPFGNKRVDVLLENFVAPPEGPAPDAVAAADAEPGALPHLNTFYFGIPPNDKLLAYWDLLADRLFKVRHCMNISGAVRQLALFEPAIDPALLVKAAAAGVDLSSVLSLGAGPVSQYRFPYLADRAAQLAAEVRVLGERLLAALERRDAEALALLRAGHEATLLDAVTEVRQQQITEALKVKAALEKSLDVIDKRISYYGDIPRMNAWEIAGTVAHGAGVISEIVATVLSSVAGATAIIPQIKAGAAGFGGSPTLTVEIGGQQASRSSFNFAAMFAGLAGILHHGGDMLNTQGSYTRQDEGNRFNKALAELERAQVEVHIEAAGIRHGIAERELANHELSLEQAQTVEEYLRTKYTDVQLYDWLLGQLSTVYFQAYQLAFDMARRAERSFQIELAEPSTSFIQFGYWDSLKRGLLAGERLTNDLRRMEAAYLDRNTREFELTKHVSLAEVDPLALLALKLTGGTNVALPEWLFDLDHPGHYRRRLRSVALSIPCVVGPYTGINCTLSLTNNGIRLTDSVAGGYGDPLTGADPRFLRSPAPVSAIATSHGVTDRGLFELNFADQRFLPFEYAGAVSEWRIDLPAAQNRFDLGSITDVVLHVEYTALPGGSALAGAARDNLDEVLPTSGAQLLVLDERFATAWYRFLHPEEGSAQVLRFTLRPEHLPFWARARMAAGATATVSGVDVVLDTPAPAAYAGTLALPTVAGPAGSPVAVPGPTDTAFGGMPHLASTPPAGRPVLGDWELQLRRDTATDFTSLTAEEVRHAYLVVRFALA